MNIKKPNTLEVKFSPVTQISRLLFTENGKSYAIYLSESDMLNIRASIDLIEFDSSTDEVQKVLLPIQTEPNRINPDLINKVDF